MILRTAGSARTTVLLSADHPAPNASTCAAPTVSATGPATASPSAPSPRTVNRELSALRSAIAWWRRRHWLSSDPTAGLRHVASQPQAMPPLSQDQATRLFGATPSLREHAFWRVLYDSGASAEDVLRLDVGNLDLPRHRARLQHSPRAGSRAGTGSRPGAHSHASGRPGARAPVWISWREGTSQLLRWLVAARPDGPVFLTDRRAPAGSDPAHVCPLTGRARMSYRRAVEIFTAATRPLDNAGKGWALQQLRQARRAWLAAENK